MYEVNSQVLEISKALGEDTRFAIFREIASADAALTVKDLVARFGMHHSAIRIHLNKLEEAGLIVSRKRHTPGAVGRPQLAFLPNPKALSVSLPPRNYHLLSDLSIQFIGASGMTAEEAAEFGFQWGREHMRRANGYDGGLPFTESMDLLLQELNGLGNNFAMISSNGGSCVIQQSNCPFLEVALKHRPLVCSMLQGVARGMLTQATGQEIAWIHRSSMVEGDACCEVEVSALGPVNSGNGAPPEESPLSH